jgi:hypothetical protein
MLFKTGDVAPDDSWWERVSMSALLRAAFRSYGDVVRAAVADAGFDDLQRNGAYVIGATAKDALTMQQLPSALGVTKQAFQPTRRFPRAAWVCRARG